MTSLRRSFAGAAVALMGLVALPAAAGPLAALSAHDVTLYQSAFDAAERGDGADAEKALSQVSDRCLAGRVKYLELTRAQGADYQALVGWLKSFADLPGARDIYHLALKLKPGDASPPEPAVAEGADLSSRLTAAAESKPARDAYYAGDLGRALELAQRDGDAWIAGLADWRLGDDAGALISFEALAEDSAAGDETRAAAGVWAARAATAAGLSERAAPLLKIAARSSSFYGMVARRKLELAADPLGALIDEARRGAVPAATRNGTSPDDLARTDPRAHRAVALMQLSRGIDAGEELRAGLVQAADERTRAEWMALMYELGPDHLTGEIELQAPTPTADGAAAYPTPSLAPAGGFTVDKALVYAVVWQESRFNGLAVSPVGATGLMQLMPRSAASVAGDDSLADHPVALFDAGKNLALGQAYITWLEENAADYDILRTLAAYNGGPTTLSRTEALVGPQADSLTVLESLPYAETRTYVKKVMAAYWTYRRQFGATTRTLDALASDLPRIDIRLDAPLQGGASAAGSTPAQDLQTQSAPAREALEILLRRSAG